MISPLPPTAGAFFCPDGWELLTVAHPCPYKGVGDPSPYPLLSYPMPQHYPNTPRHIAQVAALVTTRPEGSPLTEAPRHTIVAALTPAAAAALLRTLDGQALPAEVADLVVGLRGAAIHALAEA